MHFIEERRLVDMHGGVIPAGEQEVDNQALASGEQPRYASGHDQV